jgi:hypothetical protein
MGSLGCRRACLLWGQCRAAFFVVTKSRRVKKLIYSLENTDRGGLFQRRLTSCGFMICLGAAHHRRFSYREDIRKLLKRHRLASQASTLEGLHARGNFAEPSSPQARMLLLYCVAASAGRAQAVPSRIFAILASTDFVTFRLGFYENRTLRRTASIREGV